MGLESFERAVECATGRSIESIRSTPLDDQRAEIERERGRPLDFVSRFPLIGRGFILRDRLVSHREAEAMFKSALRRV